MSTPSRCQEQSKFLTGKPIMRGALLTLAKKVAKSFTVLENQIWAHWLCVQIQKVLSWLAWIWRKILIWQKWAFCFEQKCFNMLCDFVLLDWQVLCWQVISMVFHVVSWKCVCRTCSVGSCSCVDILFAPSYVIMNRNTLIVCSVSHLFCIIPLCILTHSSLRWCC